MKPSTQRTLVALAVFVVVGVGLGFSTGLGTPSSFGWDSIATICPIGSLETILSQWAVTPHGLLCLAITVVLILIFGRAFCGWFCPTPLMRRVFGSKKLMDKDRSDLHDTCAAGCAACGKPCSTKKRDSGIKNSPLDSRYAVLAGALLSTAIFGFPVFCLVCPVGLSVATFIGLWRLIQYNDATWSLVVFPLIVFVELFLLRKWCHRFCPLAAFASLVARGNRTLRPTVDGTVCIREQGKGACHLCYEACPEAIDLHNLAAGAPLAECMKCRECVAACPEDAIELPLAPVKVKSGTQVRIAGVGEEKVAAKSA